MLRACNGKVNQCNTLLILSYLCDCLDHDDGGADDDEEREEEAKGEKEKVVTSV